MAVTKRGIGFYIYFRPFMSKKVGLRLYDVTTMREARVVQTMIARACRTGDYRILDPVSREACIRMFTNQGWELPPGLGVIEKPKEALTLWDAIKLCLTYPGVKESSNRERHESAFVHVVRKWGKHLPVKDVRIPDIKRYLVDRQNEGGAASTINKEKAALSKMFQVLVELGLCESNPVRLVKGLDERDGRREVYLSADDFSVIMEHLPAWVQPIIQTIYFTGMRRAEAVNLTWENVNLDSRMIHLQAHQTKERNRKRVPIHEQLLPILHDVGKVRSIKTDRVFLTDRGQPPLPDSLRKPWRQAVRALSMDPAPTIHDLRHVWKVNAMRSGMDFELRETILGHSKGIAGRYGYISDEDLRSAVDGMSFDWGESQLWVARKRKEPRQKRLSPKKGNKMETGAGDTKKQGVGRFA